MLSRQARAQWSLNRGSEAVETATHRTVIHCAAHLDDCAAQQRAVFFELRFDRDTRAIYTFGRAVRLGQPHLIWCRIGSDDQLDERPPTCNPVD